MYFSTDGVLKSLNYANHCCGEKQMFGWVSMGKLYIFQVIYQTVHLFTSFFRIFLPSILPYTQYLSLKQNRRALILTNNWNVCKILACVVSLTSCWFCRFAYDRSPHALWTSLLLGARKRQKLSVASNKEIAVHLPTLAWLHRILNNSGSKLSQKCTCLHVT